MSRIKLAVAATAVLVVIAGWWIYQRTARLYPLPPVGAIASIEASLVATSSDQRSFVVPVASWQPLLDSLQPVRRDDDPAKWQGLAILTINAQRGDPLSVQVFRISKGPGGFALTDKQGARTYYRGGNSAEIERILQSARGQP